MLKEYNFNDITFVKGSVKSNVKSVLKAGSPAVGAPFPSAVYIFCLYWLSIYTIRVVIFFNMGFIAPCATGTGCVVGNPSFSLVMGYWLLLLNV